MANRSDQAIVSAGDAARRASGATRETSTNPASVPGLRLAVVLAAASGVYQVGIVGSDGEVGSTIPGVRAWGDATFAVNDRVFLTFIGERPIQYIVSGGSAGGGGDYVVTGLQLFLR